MELKSALRDKLSEDDILHVGRAFELVGTIAIVEFGEIAVEKKKVVANVLLNLHKNIETVVEKTEDISGEYRVASFHVLAGSNTTETIHKENGCSFRVDITKAYFSSRLGSERLRVARQVRPLEKVLCLFAGVGPFAINIARQEKTATVLGVEINPDAVSYFEENLAINRVGDRVSILGGDVATVVPSIAEVFDRIVLPAPKNAEDFLDLVLPKLKKGGYGHLYTFAAVEELGTVGGRIKDKAKELGCDIDVLLTRKCGNVGAYHYRVVVDFLKRN